MKAIIYARVSTDEQAGNYSLPTQIAACQTYAEKNGMSLIGTFQDDFTGTKPIEERPEGAKAYAMLANGEAEALIIFSMDRLVRPPEEGDEWEVITLIRGLARLGKEIHRVDRGRMGTSFAEILNSVLDAKSAGDWRRKLIECTMRGKRAKAESGSYVGQGKAPYGFKRVGERKTVTLAIDEDEARIVRLMREWILTGDESGKPLSGRMIAQKLGSMRIESPGVSRKSAVKRSAATYWAPNSVYEILKDETIAGTWYFGRKKFIDGKLVSRDRSQWLPATVPAIITPEQYDAIQERLKENRRRTQPQPKRPYLMQGRLRCAECDSSLTAFSNAQTKTHTYLYYHCNASQTKRGYDWDHPTCRAHRVRAEKLDAKVWEWIQSLFEDPGKLTRGLRKKQAEQDKGTQLLREKLGFIDRQLEGCQQQLRNQIALFSGMEVSEETKAAFAEQEKQLSEQIQSLKTQRQKYLKKIADCVISDEAIQSLEDTARKMDKGFKKANFDQRRIVIERLDVRGTVSAQEKGTTRVQVTCMLDETKLLEIGRMAKQEEQPLGYLLQLPITSKSN